MPVKNDLYGVNSRPPADVVASHLNTPNSLSETLQLAETLREIKRQAGLTARYGINGVAGLASVAANPLAYIGNKVNEAVGSDYRFPEQFGAVQGALTQAGLPEPQGAIEKGVGFAAEMGVPDPSDSVKVLSALNHMIDPNMAMTLFHGSPHKFDEFKMSQIGTGEGAQAYGHGLYFAEDPKVAGQYQRQLSEAVFKKPDGTVFDPYADGGLQNRNLKAEIFQKNGDVDAVIKRAEELIQSIPGTQGAELAQADLQVLRKLKAEGGLTKDAGSLYEVDIPDEHIDKMLDWDKPLSEQPESVRRAIESDPEVMRILEGKRKAKAAHAEARANQPNFKYTLAAEDDFDVWKQKYSDPKGEQIYNAVQEAHPTGSFGFYAEGDNPAELASKRLNELGIPGIKYLDGTSRNMTQGTKLPTFQKDGKWYSKVKSANDPNGTFTTSMPFDSKAQADKWADDKIGAAGTRNFVVFDENSVKTLSRNGEPLK